MNFVKLLLIFDSFVSHKRVYRQLLSRRCILLETSRPRDIDKLQKMVQIMLSIVDALL